MISDFNSSNIKILKTRCNCNLGSPDYWLYNKFINVKVTIAAQVIEKNLKMKFYTKNDLAFYFSKKKV